MVSSKTGAVHSDFRSLLERIDRGDADLALSASPIGVLDQRFRNKTLYEESFAVLYDRTALGQQGPMDLRTWLSTDQALLTVSGDLRSTTDDALAEVNQERRIVIGLSHFPTVPFVLRKRRCLVNMPAVAAYFFAREYQLEISVPPLEMPEFPVSLTWHLRTDADPFHIWFRSMVCDEVAKLCHEAAPQKARSR